MKTEFAIAFGKMTFLDTCIEIIDNAQRGKRNYLFLNFSYILIGTLLILRFLKVDHQFLLWLGILLIIQGIYSFVNFLRQNSNKQISYGLVEKAIIKKGSLNSLLAVFVIKKSFKRRVVMLNSAKSKGFDKNSLEELKMILKEKNITTEIKIKTDN